MAGKISTLLLLCAVSPIAAHADAPAAAPAVAPAKAPAVASGKGTAQGAAAKQANRKLLEKKRDKNAVDVEAGLAPPRRGDLEANKRHFEGRVRPVLNAELHFVNRICAPSVEQRQPISKGGEQSLQKVAAKLAKGQQQMQQGGFNGNTEQQSVRAMIQDGLSAALKAALRPEQLERYQQELEKSRLYRRRALSLLIVAKFDRVLLLTDEQRQKIDDELVAHWSEDWEQSRRLWQQNEEYYPQIQDQFVVRFLNKDQVSVWQGLQRIGRVHFGDVDQNELEGMDAPPWTASP